MSFYLVIVHPYCTQLNEFKGCYYLPIRACAHVFPFTIMGFWASQDWALMLAKGPVSRREIQVLSLGGITLKTSSAVVPPT